MPDAPRRQLPPPLTPFAAVLAWLWPGLGHISLGERKRGGLIMFGVLFLYLSGLLVGGLDAVDRRNDWLWFLAQGLCGPIAFATDWANQTWVQDAQLDWENDYEARHLYQNAMAKLDAGEALDEREQKAITSARLPGLSHVNEMGTLFIALGGLMNLVVILDALYAPPHRRTDRRGAAA